MFTDDANLFISDENIGKLFQQMNEELKGVCSWFDVNKLFIDIDKTLTSRFFRSYITIAN